MFSLVYSFSKTFRLIANLCSLQHFLSSSTHSVSWRHSDSRSSVVRRSWYTPNINLTSATCDPHYRLIHRFLCMTSSTFEGRKETRTFFPRYWNMQSSFSRQFFSCHRFDTWSNDRLLVNNCISKNAIQTTTVFFDSCDVHTAFKSMTRVKLVSFNWD